jgi:hypothetical protein
MTSVGASGSREPDPKPAPNGPWKVSITRYLLSSTSCEPNLPLALRPSLTQRSTQRRSRPTRKSKWKCRENSLAGFRRAYVDLNAMTISSSCLVGSRNAEGDPMGRPRMKLLSR